MKYTVLITERENIINPNTMRVYESDAALHALSSKVETYVEVETGDEHAAMETALKAYERRFYDSKSIAEVVPTKR